MPNKKKFNLKEEYQKSWKFIKESKNFIYIVIGIVLVSCLVGYFIPPSETLSSQILEFLEEIIEKTKGMSRLELSSFIFWNNLKASFIGMISGILFGIYPILVSLTNGYVIGFVSNLSVQETGISSLLNLFPHGIFELPALFISLGLGLKFGTSLFNKDKNTPLNYLKNSLRVFLLVVIPLLIIASIIESYLIVLLS